MSKISGKDTKKKDWLFEHQEDQELREKIPLYPPY